MTMYGGYPMKTFRMGDEKIEVPDWEKIQGREIAALLGLAESIGYGRCIQILHELWYRKARANGSGERQALLESGTVCVWCNTDGRTGKKLPADTSGESR